MENLSLVLAHEADLTVKSFVARETLSAPFDVEVIAYAPADNLPFEAIVGHKASFRVVSPWPGAAPRIWTGIVRRVEQIDAEPSGATTYSIHIGPALWRLGRRTNCRIYQHLSIPEIASSLLAEWEILPLLRLDPSAFARHEYRVQYGETDLAFLSRLLEEAGIAYLFEEPELPAGEDADTQTEQPYSQLILAEDATRREPRAASLEYWNTKDLPNDREAVASVRSAREVRAGRATIRDLDYRTRPRHKLLASAVTASESESRIETFEYAPGAFVIEPSPDGARVDEREAQARADKALAAERGGRFAVTYRTNVLDLSPGVVFSMHGHPHPDLGDKRALLVTAQRIEGNRSGEWTVSGEATFGDEPHRPSRKTPRPRISGVQSAFVVGPAGEEIHTDAMGRVRVEFPWDREGKSDERSSCFLRVSQGWAGPGYGIVAVPRIGEEVLVTFFDGDPDQPVIVGRVHNGAAPPPQPLPANKTKSIWRTNSTPGGGGYNELALDDKKGEEVVALRAERDFERTVLREERAAIGASLTTKIGESEVREIEVDQTVKIGGNRQVSIAGSDSWSVAESLQIDLGQGVGGTFSKDKKIILSTGEASIVLDGPNLYIDAKAILSLRSGDTLSLSGGDVSIDGQPNVNLNGGQASQPKISLLDGAFLDIDLTFPPGVPPPNVLADLLSGPILDPGMAPGQLSLPPEVEALLAADRNKILAGIDEIISKIESAPDLIGQDVLPEVEAARAWAKARIEAARAWLEQAKARVAEEIAKWKAELVALKTRIEEAAAHIKDKIQGAITAVQERLQALRDRGRELLQGVKDKIQYYKDMIKSKFDELRAQAIEFKNKVVGPFEEIRNSVKGLIQNVKDTVAELKQTITGIVDDVKSTVKEIKDTVANIKKEVNDLFGLKSAIADIKNDIQEIKNDVKETIEGAKEAWNDAKQGVQDAVDDVKDIFGGGDDGDALFSGALQGGPPQGGLNPPAGGLQSPPGKIGGGAGAPKIGGATPRPGAHPTPHLTASSGRGAGQHGLHLNEPHAAGRGATPLGNTASAHASAGHAAQTSHAVHRTAGATSAAGSPGQGFDLREAVAQADSASRDAGGQAGSIVATAQDVAGSANGALNGGRGAPPANPLLGSTVVTRGGGITPDSMVDVLNAAKTPTLFQSPGEGQLLVLRTERAASLSTPDFTRTFVDGQMDGLPPSDAFAAALQSNGYLVYERPWDSWLTSLIKKAVL